MQSRLTTLVANLPDGEVDAIRISGAENGRQPSGISGPAGCMFISDERGHMPA